MNKLKPEPLYQLSKRIREIRQRNGYTQERLAEECDFDRTYISLLERGQRNPSFTNLLKLAKGLKTTIAELCDGI